MSDFWVFGYGSLMWRPGFDHLAAVPARLAGAHRSLCVYSWVHRGTEAHPGLVLGLDHGGACRGVAYRVAGTNRDAVLAYLREREQVTGVYREVTRPVTLLGQPAPVPAVVYMVDRRHVQYAGALPRDRLLELVRDSAGISGGNAEYIVNTVAHLRQAGIYDGTLEWLAGTLQAGTPPADTSAG